MSFVICFLELGTKNVEYQTTVFKKLRHTVKTDVIKNPVHLSTINYDHFFSILNFFFSFFMHFLRNNQGILRATAVTGG